MVQRSKSAATHMLSVKLTKYMWTRIAPFIADCYFCSVDPNTFPFETLKDRCRVVTSTKEGGVGLCTIDFKAADLLQSKFRQDTS